MGLLCVNTNILQIITASDEKSWEAYVGVGSKKDRLGCRKRLERKMKVFLKGV